MNSEPDDTAKTTIAPPGAPPPAAANGRPPAPSPAPPDYRNRRSMIVLTGVVIGLLSLTLLAGTFLAGYFVGKGRTGPDGTAQGDRFGRSSGWGRSNNGLPLVRRARQMIRSGEAELVRGTVESSDDGNVSVNTGQESRVIAVTANTRYAGGRKPAPGERVAVFARKTADGGCEALVIRCMQGEGASPR